VLATVTPTAAPRDQWFAANSAARLGRGAETADRLGRLATSTDPAWVTVASLMRTRLAGDQGALAAALEASQAFSTHAAVQVERGRGHALRGEPEQAAAAFDRAIEADPRLAYAYYYGALAYNTLGQTAVAGARLETFLRVAPDAPERPEVRSILGTLGR
jgi:tetratricopeptide (TPR) repeat protein